MWLIDIDVVIYMTSLRHLCFNWLQRINLITEGDSIENLNHCVTKDSRLRMRF